MPAGEHLQKGVHLVEADTELPPFFDTFEDFKEFCFDYRTNLGKIVRLCACLLPEPALMSAHRRLSNAIQICSTSGVAPQVTTAAFLNNMSGLSWGVLITITHCYDSFSSCSGSANLN